MQLQQKDTVFWWSAVLVPPLIALCGLMAVAVHLGLGIAWHRLAFPAAAMAGLQAAACVGFLAGRSRVKSRGDWRTVFVVWGGYSVISCLMIMHYSAEWKISNAFPRSDYVPFSVTVSALTVVSYFILSRGSRKYASNRGGGNRDEDRENVKGGARPEERENR
jgi:hypothetical protein